MDIELIQTSEEEVIEKVEEVEDIELQANDDGSLDEVYRDKRTGNIVMNPKDRYKSRYDNDRKERCWNYYLASVREGNPNARQSALKAGFAPNTAINIGNIRWFKEKKDKLRRSKMMSNAERNISRMLNIGITKLRKLEDGSTEEIFDAEKARIVADMSKLIVTTLGKDEGWSTKTEVKVTSLPAPILNLEALDITPDNILLEDNITDKE